MFCGFSLFDSKEFWALLGVALGFSLTEISRLIKSFVEKKKLRKALLDELEINYFQLEHKKDTIKSIIAAIDKMEILPAISVGAASAVYEHNTASVILLLKPIERDIVENIYSRMKIVDVYLNTFENNLMNSIKDKIAADPWKVYKSKSSDMFESCKVSQEYIKSVLENKPIDIYKRKDKIPFNERIFAGVITSENVRKQRNA